MYRYYQTGEHSAWSPIKDSNDVVKRALDAGATKLSILAVSEVIDDETTDRDTLTYKGPLYFDIDNKDLLESKASTIELVDKLVALGVNATHVQVYASGSKGFHVIVPATVFSSGRPVHGLPYIYLELALRLYVLGMDLQVYCGGKGNCFRIPNVQRGDGRYRVPITHAELRAMTPEQYAVMCSAPRRDLTHVEDAGDSNKSASLEALFEEARKAFKAKPKLVAPIADEELAQFRETAPQCIQHLAKYEIKSSVNYNQAALQMAIFLARSGMEEHHSSGLISLMASNSHSTKYDTARARTSHLKGLTQYVSVKKAMKFSCAATRATLQQPNVCDDCPLKGKTEESKVDAVSIGIEERQDGYYALGKEDDRPISNFILDPISVHMEESRQGTIDRRVGVVMEVVRDGMVLGTIMFNETGWDSKSAFIGEVRGISDLMFTGSDHDVQKIKNIVMREGREIGTVIQVFTTGIHTHKVGKKELLVYVEPGYSINQLKVQGTHVVGGMPSNPPHIKDTSMPEVKDEEVNDALSNLLKINRPDIVAQLVGWYSACHLKAHIKKISSEFPVLNLWGNAGAGKTETAGLLSWLNGCEFLGDEGVLLVSAVTEWALIDYCTSSTTVPRILDEYNRSKMPGKKYDYIGEVIKAAWNSSSIKRGGIAKASSNRGRTGAVSIDLPISAPLVVLSEQAPQMPAVRQRMLQVMMTAESRQGCTAAFSKAKAKKANLQRFAKAMVGAALSTPIATVEKMLDEVDQLLPDSIVDRPRRSYQIALLGLEFFERTARALELPVADEVDSVRKAMLEIIDGTAKEIERSKRYSEVDAVIESLGQMAALTLDGTEQWIIHGKHYLVKGDSLLIDMAIVHVLYMRFAKSNKSSVVIDKGSVMSDLLRQEPYYVTDKRSVPEFISGRPVWELSMSKMREKGLEVSLFQR